jgi:DNA-directed RNA polymerase specialized sigma24 family protein/transposase-like protein
VTVQADADPVRDVNPGAADQQFAEIFKQYRPRLERYLSWVLKTPYHPLAEDLAQESFLYLWRDYLSADGLREPEKVYGLLKVIARHRVHEYFKAARNRESTVDYTDSANRDLDGRGHGYALGIPHVALLVTELEEATERMSEASEKWRGLNKESARLRMQLADNYRDHLGGLSESYREDCERKAEAVERQEETALVVFRDACRRVGDLRAEIERTAGANWRSCVGMPPSQAPHRALSYAKDSSATHCSKGHLLDRLNTAFTESGERRCRACGREKNLKSKPRITGAARKTVAPDVLEQARQLLADASLKHSIRSVAEALNVSQMTLYRAFPGGVSAVRQAALEAAAR